MHCPATLLLTPAPQDEGDVSRLVERVASDGVLAVVSAPGGVWGRRLADALGAPLEEEPGLAAGVTSPSRLAEIADLHRGETVLVLTPTGETGETGVVRRIELGEAY